MPQTSFALMTSLGRAKEAAALANAGTLTITHIAIGDGNTVPSGGETELYNEVDRKTISGHGVVVGAENTAFFDCFLAAGDGPYTIREAGLIDDEGDLIAIARYDPPISKPIPESGQTVEGTIRLEVMFSDIANVTIVVDPAMMVALQRLTRLPWIPVISMTTAAPPSSPAVGDTYLIPDDATGAWDDQDGNIAEYTTAGWAIIEPRDGHGIGLPDGRVFARVGGVYTEFPVGANNAPIYPEILVNFGRFTVTTAVGLVTIDAGQPWQHRGLKTYSTDAFSATPGQPNSRAFVTAANKTYHAVWDAPGTGLAVPLETYPDGKMTLVDMTGASPAEDDPSYDTTFDHMLHLKVVTDGANNPTVTRLFNRHTLTAAGDKQTITRSTAWGSTSTGLTSTPNWARTPQISLRYFSCDIEPVFEAVDWLSVVATRYAYTAYCGGYITDPSYQPNHFVNGRIGVFLRA